MLPTDKAHFCALLYGIGEIYGKPVSEGMAELYWRLLEGYPLDAIAAAFEQHLRHPDTGHYWPKPADIVRQVEGGATKDRAARAWAKVERELRRVGAYASVVFDDPVIMRALADLGGWPALCHATLEVLPFRAKDFKDLYAAYAVQHAEYPRVLPGLVEQHHTANGLPAPPPVLLGEDKAAALQVYQSGKDPHAIAPPLRECSQVSASVFAPGSAGPALPQPTPAAALTVQEPPQVQDQRAAA